MDHAAAVARRAEGKALFTSCLNALQTLYHGCLASIKALLVAFWVILPDLFFRDWSCLGTSEGCMRTAVAAIGGFSVSWGVLTALSLVTLALLGGYWSSQAPTVVVATPPGQVQPEVEEQEADPQEADPQQGAQAGAPTAAQLAGQVDNVVADLAEVITQMQQLRAEVRSHAQQQAAAHAHLQNQIDALPPAQQGDVNGAHPTPARRLAMQRHAIKPQHQALVAPLVAAAEAFVPHSDIKTMVASLSEESTVNGVDNFTNMAVLNGCHEFAGTIEPEKVKCAAIAVLLLLLRRIAATPGHYNSLWARIGGDVQQAGSSWSKLNKRFINNNKPYTKDQMHEIVALGLGMTVDQVKKLPGKCRMRTGQAAALTMLGMLMQAGVLQAA